MRYDDRPDAGRALARVVRDLHLSDVVVLGLPRGGVPVAAVVAAAPAAPLDVVVVRKLGVPGQPELAMGAVGEGGTVVSNDGVRRRAGVDPAQFDEVLARERAEVERRVARLRGGRPPVVLQGRTAVVVDDGLATGATARAACAVVRAAGAATVVLAVPVAAADTLAALRAEVDLAVAAHVPADFRSVGRWYRDFSQTSDDEVARLLA